ncbi:MAG: hypothetical protein SGPRY_007744 [Prymnesium sp.]
MNKQREQYRPDREGKLCMAFLNGRECSFGESCRFSHDLRSFLANKPADLGETCPIFTLKGRCKFGVTCRYGRSHILEDGTSVVSESFSGEGDEMNHSKPELSALLRKNKYDFSRADTLSKAILADVQRQQDLANASKAERERLSAEQVLYSERNVSDTQPVEREKRVVDFRGKILLAPLTTVGNLPFRRVCKSFGVDITCGEMALATNLLQGQYVAFQLHKCEDIFGVQLAGNHAETMGRTRKILTTTSHFDAVIIARYSNVSNFAPLLHGMPTTISLQAGIFPRVLFSLRDCGNGRQPTAHLLPPLPLITTDPHRAAQVIDEEMQVDFIDINMGCPIDVICNKGCGSALALRPGRVQSVVRTMSTLLSCPLTVKMRTGYDNNKPIAHNLIPKLAGWGASAVTLHGRSRQQRYSRAADWDYITSCSELTELPFVGCARSKLLIMNGDVFSYEDVEPSSHAGKVGSFMVAREIKEQRHWDISASERLDMLKTFVRHGLEHWGTDDMGVAKVRNFLLEWLSFLHRYVPVGLLERLPAKLQVEMAP